MVLSASSGTIAAGERTTLGLTFLPFPNEGPRAWTLRLATNLPDASVREVPISAQVEELDGCQTWPSVTSASRVDRVELIVTNAGVTACVIDGAPVVQHWSLDPPGVDSWVLEPGGQQSIRVGFDGGGTGTLTFDAVGLDPSEVIVLIQSQ